MIDSIVVTGAAGLLGKAFSRRLAEDGYHVFLVDVDEVSLDLLSTEFALDGLSITTKVTDITSLGSVQSLLAEIQSSQTNLVGVVNNAYPRNAEYGKKFENVTYESFTENVSKHLGGYFLVCQQFAEYFLRNSGGSIINMTSIYGSIAPRFEIYNGTEMTMPVEYAAIKAGVSQLTKYIAEYYKGQDIRCLGLAPGGIRNGQPESFQVAYDSSGSSKGLLDPIDISGVLSFLFSSDAQYINGSILTVDDGWSL